MKGRRQSVLIFDKINKDILIKSKVGLKNAAGSYYMAQIIQILIHLEKFITYFEKYKWNELCKAVNKFLKKKEKAQESEESFEIRDISNYYKLIIPKFKGTKGNKPMTFFNEFISHLSENIMSSFMRKN